MWIYEKKLQYPAKVGRANLRMAKYLITQYGGPDGELAASMRYLTQRYTMPTGQAKAILTDIGTEELAHLEIIATLVYKLMDRATVGEIEAAGLGAYYADHDKALYLVNGEGVPGPPRISSPRATRWRTSMRTWPQRRKPGQPMNG